MRRLLYRLTLANIAVFMVTTLLILSARQLTDPVGTPFQMIRLSLAHALVLDDPAMLESQLEHLHETLDAQISVYDDAGELSASSVHPPLPMPTRDRGFLGGYVDVEYGDTHGRIVTSPPLQEFLRQMSRELLLVWLIVCGLALLMVLWVTRRLSAPLETLVEAARGLGAGDLDARAGLERDDEIGEVGRAFDVMAARLSLLLRSQRELLASVSHEFRTPLARMRLVSEMLAEGDDVRELLPELDTDIAELDRLVERVLEAAALDLRAAARGGQMPSLSDGVREGIGGRELLERVAARFALAHPERTLELELSPGPLLELQLQLDPLLRAFDNLLENAHRYSEVEQPITLRARVDEVGEDEDEDEGARLVIELIDRGIGIAPEHLELIFNPFFRAEPSRARHTGGLGLGLGTARTIIEACGGSLALSSELGVGSCFTICLVQVREAQPKLGQVLA